MGAVTIVSGIANLGHEYGIAGSLDAAMVLWWCTLGKCHIDHAFFLVLTDGLGSHECLNLIWSAL